MPESIRSRMLNAGRFALNEVEKRQPTLGRALKQQAKMLLSSRLPLMAWLAGKLEQPPPWLDRADADVDAYVASLEARVADPDELREQLRHWKRFGYLVLRQAVEQGLIDALLADVEDLFDHRDQYSILINSESKGLTPVGALTRADISERHLRILDFHNNSIAAKKIALHRTIVEVLGHIFREQVVAMQSLTFMHGTEQTTHQDYAYVISEIPSYLAATWMALEDVHPDAGPLGYFPGSHVLPKFDFGNGTFLTPSSTRNELDFQRHIEAECKKAGIEMQIFLPKKGDVFVWHGALAYRGCEQRDPSRTRKAFVTHYSTTAAYRFDRRQPGVIPAKYYVNGAVTYANPHHPEEEEIFTRGEKF